MISYNRINRHSVINRDVIYRAIKTTSYYSYCNSTYLLKIKQLQMN